MLEITLAASMIATPLVTYFLAKRSVRNGIISAYEDIMSDIMSEETRDEMKLMIRSLLGSASGTIGANMPKLDLKDLLIMIGIGIFKDKIPGLSNLIPGLSGANAAGTVPQQPVVYDPSRRRT